MLTFLFFLMGAGLTAVFFSGTIRKKKTRMIVGAAGWLLLLAMGTAGLLQIKSSNRVIGEVWGTEHQYISIGKDTYTACYDSDYHAKDKDRILGRVIFEDTEADPMLVYSIKNVEDHEYIYTLWAYDGCIYKKDAER